MPLSKVIAFYHLEKILAVKSLDIDLQSLSLLHSIPKEWGYINTEEKTGIPLKFSFALKFFEGLATVQINSKWGYIKALGTLIIFPQFQQESNFSERLAAVKINGNYGYVNPA